MYDYFKPWRRKVGVVTLMLTCALLVGWIRSWHTADELMINVDKRTLHWFISAGHWIGWAMISAEQGMPVNFCTYQSSKVFEHAGLGNAGPFEEVSYAWNWNESPHIVVPYVVFIVPMTMVSVWLLIGKPGLKRSTGSASAHRQ